MNDGNVVVIIDPKGDGALLRRTVVECIESGRLDDFYMFHLGFPQYSCEYNPVADFQKVTEVAGRATNQLAGEGNSAVFKEFSWRFVNINAQAMEAVGEEASYERLVHYVSNPEDILRKYLDKILAAEDPDWGQSVAEIEADIDDKQAAHMGRSKDVLALTNLAKDVLSNKEDPIIRGLVGALEYSKSYYDKIVASLLPFLDKMTTGHAKELLSPGLVSKKGRRRMRWRDVIARRGVVYVGLDALTDPVVAVAVASAMISDLCSVAGQIYKTGSNFDEPSFGGKKKPIPIILHLDEFNELITGDEIIQILNKARGAGVMCHVYSQTIKDIEAKIGSSAKAAQIIGNLQNLIMMRVRDDATAELLTKQLPMVEVSSNTEVSGTKDNGELHSFSTDNSDRATTKEKTMLEISDITSLPKGQAFVYKNGGELHKVRFPMFSADRVNIPEEVDLMVKIMKEQYQTSDNWGERLNGKA
jgi:conjugative coupling factor TraD (TOL family)